VKEDCLCIVSDYVDSRELPAAVKTFCRFDKPIQVFMTDRDFVPAPESEAADLRACQQACRDWIKRLGLVRSTLSTSEKLIEDVLVDDLATHSGPRPINMPAVSS